MKSLKQSAQDYIRMRRLLGFKMWHEERRLRRFVSFMELQKATYITTKAGADVGDGACRCATRHLGRTADVRTCFRALLQRRGSTHGGSSVRHLTVPGATSHALPL